MKKRGWILLLAAVLLLAVGCGGSEKILSTEGVPQEVLQSAQYKAALHILEQAGLKASVQDDGETAVVIGAQ